MTTKKTPLTRKPSLTKRSATGLPTDAHELDSFIETLDASGDLAFLMAKPKKKRHEALR